MNNNLGYMQEFENDSPLTILYIIMARGRPDLYSIKLNKLKSQSFKFEKNFRVLNLKSLFKSFTPNYPHFCPEKRTSELAYLIDFTSFFSSQTKFAGHKFLWFSSCKD